jgi:undecaprenyl-diphosphatase
MTLLYSIILGVIQGLTEFLPVSSTAHLTLVENLLLKRSMPLAFDVLLHVGTLLALVIYFRQELARMILGLFGWDAEGRRLTGWLLVAMVPTVLFALLTRHVKELAKDHIWIYGACLFLTALLLYAANEASKRKTGRNMRDLQWLDALAVGAIQGIGGGFGLSRSGSTISIGVLRGLKLQDATRFSFLLGIPTILGAAVLEGWHVVKPLLHHAPLPADAAFPAGSISPAMACLVGVAAAAVSGYAAIGLLDRLLRRPRLSGFAVYCVLAGLALLYLGLSGPQAG